ncbi:MAG: radical SAM protein [Bacteroidetes bacterium]|nr:radical SAM protein [Bacteroidota bacterium]
MVSLSLTDEQGPGSVRVVPTTARSALRKIPDTFPHDGNVNPFIGCAHGCHYCFAQYTETYQNKKDFHFFSEIKVKTNIAAVLDKELSRPYWQGKLINLGGVTDAYQPAEKDHQLMPEIWKTLIRHRSPVVISSKSSLILRDMELIDRLSRLTFVNVASTIITDNESLARRIEPGASTPVERFSFLKNIKENTRASTGVHIMPVIPLITDSAESFHQLFARSVESKADYTVEYPLHLSGRTRTHFLSFFKKEFPEKYNVFIPLFQAKHVDQSYFTKLRSVINSIKSSYPLGDGYMELFNQRLVTPQLSIDFD